GKEIQTTNITKRQRIQDLLIILILHRNEGLPKKVIFDLFWENYSEECKRTNLNTLIYRLKKVFGTNNNFFKIDRHSISLNMDHVDIDIDKFQTGIRTFENMENTGNIEEAINFSFNILELYKGSFLDNLNTKIPIIKERMEFKHLYQTLLFRTLRLTVYRGLYIESLKLGKKLISSDPYCEPAYRLIMTALSFLGNTSEITRLYIDLKKKLQDNYSIDPDEKTLLLKNKLLLGVNPEQYEILEEVSIFF
ncbi:MAG: BTAD domain-containing putative transcriptional regulator, partial [Spirochaetota bacterium]|nr:BTAD domain-containing putative transcriptional regulator [Spirochaetota bacterium]